MSLIPLSVKSLVARAADSLGYEIRRKGSAVPYTLEVAFEHRPSYLTFRNRANLLLRDCDWQPHPHYSVFTQFDKEFYLARREEFLTKYRTFWTVARACDAKVVAELGTHAAAGADAYLSGAPGAKYYGFDLFDEGMVPGTNETWRPYEMATALLTERGYDFELIKANLRSLEGLPVKADFVAVDAAHDFASALLDMRLALTADPSYVWIDDCADGVKEAAEVFIREDLKGRVEFTHHFPYVGGGGLLVKLKT